MFEDLAINLKLLQDDKDINFEHFLETASKFSRIFDCLGSFIKVLVKTDFEGNIKKLQDFNKKQGNIFKTVIMMLDFEQNTKQINPAYKYDGTCSLIWLLRGMNYICCLVEKVIDSEGKFPLKELAQDAYNEVLSPYHGYMSRTIISNCFYLVPSYESFMESLSTLNPDEDVKINASQFVKQLKPIINTFMQYYITHKIEKEFNA